MIIFRHFFIIALIFGTFKLAGIEITKVSDNATVSSTPKRFQSPGGIESIYPEVFKNARFVVVPRGTPNAPGSGFWFEADQATTVYLVVQNDEKLPPSWQPVDKVMYWEMQGKIYRNKLYQQQFKAGRIEIPAQNSKNGSKYAPPHAAIIKSVAPEKPIMQFSNSGKYQRAGSRQTINNQPAYYIANTHFSIPAATISPNKVYLFSFYAEAPAKGGIITLDVPPEIQLPFGNRTDTRNIWSKVIFPFFVKESPKNDIIFRLNSNFPEMLMELPSLREDRSGIRLESNQIHQFFPGPKWKSIKMGNLNSFMLVKPGTALDVSKQTLFVPAGERGRVIINDKGRLAFEKKPEESVRFRGCTINFFNETTKAQLDAEIDRCVISGINLVRFHWPRFAKQKYQRNVTIDKAKFFPLNQEEFKEYFDENKLKLFDYALDKLAKHGIYVFFDIMTSFTGWTDAGRAGHYQGKDLLDKQFHAQLYVNEKFRKNWSEGCRFLLDRKNTVNGKNWKDDPVFAIMLFMNEQDFRTSPSFLRAFEPEWHEYYGQKNPKLSEKLLKSNSEAGQAAGKFILRKIQEMTNFFYCELRKIGYPGLVTNWDLYMRMIDAPGRELLQAATLHTYHGHPGLARKYNTVPGFQVSTLFGDREQNVNNRSSIIEGGAYLTRVLPKQCLNRPALITEYADTFPNPYRHEMGPFFAAYSALNNIDLLSPHGLLTSPRFFVMCPWRYACASDPIYRASDLLNFFAFQRGDVTASAHSIEFLITSELLNTKHRLDALAPEYAQLGLLTRIGSKAHGIQPLDPLPEHQADIVIKPEVFAKTYSLSVEAVASDNRQNNLSTLADIIRQMRELNILNRQNRTNPDKGIFESDTNELLICLPEGTMQITTPRLESFVIKRDVPVSGNALSITRCTTAAAVSMVSLTMDTSLKDSKHLLLIFATDAVNFGMTVNRNGNRFLRSGSAPMLLRTGELHFSLANSLAGVPEIYALNLDGTREEKLKPTPGKNGLSVSIDTSMLKYATPFFEIIYP